MNERTILIVDDDLEDIEIFSQALLEIAPAITCISARNGEEGLRLIEGAVLKPEFVFFDIHMPRFNERKFISEIRKNNSSRDIKLIIYTAALEKEYSSIAGADGLIIKPSSFSELCGIIAALITTSPPATAQVA